MVIEAALALIDSSLYGGSPPTQRQLDRLRATRRSALREMSPADRRFVGAAIIMAWVRADRFAEALDFAGAAIEIDLDPHEGDLPLESALAMDAAVAEAHIGAGHSVAGLKHAQRMAGLVEEIPDPRWRYRSLGLLAASQAINGELSSAAETLADIRALVEANGWDPDRAEYMAAVAEVVTVFAEGDRAGADSLVPRLQCLVRSEPSAKSLAALAETIALHLDGETDRAMAVATKLVQGVTHPTAPGLIRHFAVSLQAFILLREREPLRALGLLRDEDPLPNHAVCPGGLRAVAYLQLGDHAEALRATKACIQERRHHNLWLLPLVLISRGAANFALGHRILGLRDAREAMAHSSHAQLVAVSTILPAAALLPLLDVAEHVPWRSAEVRAFRDTVLAAEPPATASPMLPRLTQRERVIAHQIHTSQTLPQIAQQLHVAPSTVKSQVLSLYKKLGVSTREDAVRFLERVGFYES